MGMRRKRRRRWKEMNGNEEEVNGNEEEKNKKMEGGEWE